MKKRIKKGVSSIMPFSKDFLWGGATAANVKAAIIREDGGLPMSTLFHTEKTVFQLLQGK